MSTPEFQIAEAVKKHLALRKLFPENGLNPFSTHTAASLFGEGLAGVKNHSPLHSQNWRYWYWGVETAKQLRDSGEWTK